MKRISSTAHSRGFVLGCSALSFFSLTAVAMADADLSLSKFAVGTPRAGGPITYEYDISNLGPDPAEDVSLRDFLPDEFEFENAFIDTEDGVGLGVTPCALTAGTNVLICPLGHLEPTGSVPVLVFVNGRFRSDVPDGMMVTNFADVNLTDSTDPNHDNNSDEAQVTVLARADLEVGMYASSLVSGPSKDIQFTIVVTNNGPSDAQEVGMVDNLPLDPKKLSYVTDSGAGACLYDVTTHSVSCALGALPAGESNVIDIIVQPKGNVGVITNTASVSTTTTDPDMSNNVAVRDVRVKGGGGGRGRP